SPAFAQLFGVRQENFTMVREPDGGAIWSPPPRTWGEYLPATMLEGIGVLAGHRLRANVYIETFTVQGSEPCLMYGAQVAGVRRALGKGTAILLGTYLGHNGAAYPDESTRSAVAALLRSAGVAGNNVGRLLVRRRAISGKEAWLFTNPTERPVTETISVSGWKRVEDLLGEQLPRNGDCISLSVNSLDVRALVLYGTS
ncbi:MAG: hypothetical protein HYV36_01565, partial [Lentisphaerae bacterium]|nr:hypothetical protein [Lentisphaerota bacterium]